jgi:hypothetical protein
MPATDSRGRLIHTVIVMRAWRTGTPILYLGIIAFAPGKGAILSQLPWVERLHVRRPVIGSFR